MPCLRSPCKYLMRQKVWVLVFFFKIVTFSLLCVGVSPEVKDIAHIEKPVSTIKYIYFLMEAEVISYWRNRKLNRFCFQACLLSDDKKIIRLTSWPNSTRLLLSKTVQLFNSFFFTWVERENDEQEPQLTLYIQSLIRMDRSCIMSRIIPYQIKVSQRCLWIDFFLFSF